MPCVRILGPLAPALAGAHFAWAVLVGEEVMAESVRRSQGLFGRDTHANHGKAWSFADMDELRLHCETGGTFKGAAALLYRTFEEVREKAAELGLIR